MIVKDHKDLLIWQKSMEMVFQIYELVKSFPKEEAYGLSDQIRRAAVSIPSNISEGYQRGSDKEFSHFLRVALGSSAELETQLIICKKLGFGQTETVDLLLYRNAEIEKMINAFLRKMMVSR